MDENAWQETLGAPIEPATDDAEDGGAYKLREGAVEKGEDKGRHDNSHPRLQPHAEQSAHQHTTEYYLLDDRCQYASSRSSRLPNLG